MLVSICGASGSGKAQPHGSKVLTPNGWTNIELLKVGDEVITPTNEICKVNGVFPQGIKECVELITIDGAKTKCCVEHLWKIRSSRSTRVKNEKGEWKSTTIREFMIIETSQLMKKIEKTDKVRKNKTYGVNIGLPLCSPISFTTDQTLPIDPYMMGALLGDGSISSNTITFTTNDQFIYDKMSNIMKLDGYKLKCYSQDQVSFTIVKDKTMNVPLRPHINKYHTILQQLSLSGKVSHNKFIPPQYLTSSIDDRWKLLQGLMDTDGTVNSNGLVLTFCTVSLQLAKDVQQLVWSLGGTARMNIRKNPFYYDNNRNKVFCRVAYEITMSCITPKQMFTLPRKINRVRDDYINKIDPIRKIREINPIGLLECTCISVDHPDHLYITDDYIVTHNTTLLNHLENMGFDVVQRKTSRSILMDWNVRLDQVNSDPILTMKFQDEMLQRKVDDDFNSTLQSKSNITFTERNYVDLFVYAVSVLGWNNQYSDWLNNYYQQCLHHQQKYNKVIFIESGAFPAVNDGVRPSNSHFNTMIDLTMQHYLNMMSPNFLSIQMPSIRDRLHCILDEVFDQNDYPEYNNYVDKIKEF